MGSVVKDYLISSPEVREALVRAIRLDLVGPGPGDELVTERLPAWERPSKWYLTGFLIPAATPLEQRADEDEDEELEEVPERLGEEMPPSPARQRRDPAPQRS